MANPGRERGYILIVVPIVLVGIFMLTYQAISRSKTAMKIAGSDLNYLQTRMCAQQCAALAVNATNRSLEEKNLVFSGTLTCPCNEGKAKLQMTCVTTLGKPVYADTVNCYGVQSALAAVDLNVKCKDGANREVELKENVVFEDIPVFQFAAFFDMTLEINPGPPMNIDGRIHSNDTLNIFPETLLVVNDWVTSAKMIGTRIHHDSMPSAIGLPLMDGSGADKPFNATSVTFEPLKAHFLDWPAWLSAHRVAYATESPGCGTVSKLSLPMRNMDSPRELIEWRKPGDSYQVQRQKFAWRANLIYHQGQWLDNQLKPVAIIDPMQGTPPKPMLPGSSSPRMTFWDEKEQIMVDLLPVDMARLQQRAGDSVVYMHDSRIDPAQQNREVGGFLLYNGGKLLRPLTVATNGRLYVWGDYNVNPAYNQGGGKMGPFPAALICDAITLLSNTWTPTDWPYLGGPSKYVKAGATTLNVCIMRGKKFGSGYHNTISIVENWADVPLRYTGSTVNMWPSGLKEFSGTKVLMGIHRFPPIRAWAFDPMYKNVKNMPPATPRVVNPNLNTWELNRE